MPPLTLYHIIFLCYNTTIFQKNFAEEDYCAYSNISFRKDDIYYHIMVRDKELSAEELFTVANELICE